MGCSSSVPQEVIDQQNQDKENSAKLEALKKQRVDLEAKTRADEEAALSAEKLKEEAKRKAAEEAEAEAVRLKAEQEAAEKAAEEATRLKAEQEAAEKAAEEAARFKAEQEAAEEAARLKAELEAAEVAAAKLMAEQEAAKKAAEEAARLKAEQEAARRKAKEERQREETTAAAISSVLQEAEEQLCQEVASDTMSVLVEEAETLAREEVVRDLTSLLVASVESQIATEVENARLAAEEIMAWEARRAAEELQQALQKQVESIKMGWMSKQGYVFQSWKRFWFVLEKGILRYYAKPLKEAPYGQDLKGEMILENYIVKDDLENASCFELQTYEDSAASTADAETSIFKRLSSRRLSTGSTLKIHSVVIEAENVRDAADWIFALNTHINHWFKTDYDKKEAAQQIFMQGNLELKGILWSQRWFALKLNRLGA